MAKMTCPICKGTGKITEDAVEYEFITRDAITKRCLFCDGSGKIEPRKRMPNGVPACNLHKPNPSLKQQIIKDLTPVGADLCVCPPAISPSPLVGEGWGEGENNTTTPVGADCVRPYQNTNPGGSPAISPLSPGGRGDGGEGEINSPDTPPTPPLHFLEMATNPRLNKVLASGKDFLIITETEPYYIRAFRMIRSGEIAKGTWTPEDETRYVDALEYAFDTYMIHRDRV